jgi:hypothetical protein
VYALTALLTTVDLLKKVSHLPTLPRVKDFSHSILHDLNHDLVVREALSVFESKLLKSLLRRKQQ